MSSTLIDIPIKPLLEYLRDICGVYIEEENLIIKGIDIELDTILICDKTTSSNFSVDRKSFLSYNRIYYWLSQALKFENDPILLDYFLEISSYDIKKYCFNSDENILYIELKDNTYREIYYSYSELVKDFYNLL